MSERRHPTTGRPLMYSVEERRERHRTRTARYKKRDRHKNRLELFDELIHHCAEKKALVAEMDGAETRAYFMWEDREDWLKKEKEREENANS